MPMRRGMNFFIRWKRQAGESMGKKKDRERFSIKFNEKDPSHETVIGILEQQGPRQKAQFIANAVLHYIHCPETPDITIPQTVDRAAIEEIVAEILGRKETGKKTERRSDIRKEHAPESETVKPVKNRDGEQPPKEMNEATLALIADTMSAFRSS